MTSFLILNIFFVTFLVYKTHKKEDETNNFVSITTEKKSTFNWNEE